MKISIVIPTWNEAGRIGSLVERLTLDNRIGEVIVADAGSPDGTANVAARAEAMLSEAPAGGLRQEDETASSAELLLGLADDRSLVDRSGSRLRSMVEERTGLRLDGFRVTSAHALRFDRDGN